MMKTRSKKLSDPKRVTFIIERADMEKLKQELEGTDLTFSELIRGFVQDFLDTHRIDTQHRSKEKG